MTSGRGGLILIDRWGKVGYARNTSRMPVCYITDAADIMADS
jgi:isoaspartyl peptidase/L-asparaginase-like protein (Ntn-hydrolase superfamily)